MLIVESARRRAYARNPRPYLHAPVARVPRAPAPPRSRARNRLAGRPPGTMEATVVCIDNSEFTRDGDFLPNRFQAQADAVNQLAGAKTGANPENTVGILTCAAIGTKAPKVMVTPTTDLGKVLTALSSIAIEGAVNVSKAAQIAQLALKHRQNKNQRQRIVLFIGSPIEEDQVRARTYLVDAQERVEGARGKGCDDHSGDVLAVACLTYNVLLTCASCWRPGTTCPDKVLACTGRACEDWQEVEEEQRLHRRRVLRRLCRGQ